MKQKIFRKLLDELLTATTDDEINTYTDVDEPTARESVRSFTKTLLDAGVIDA